jgi:hypothetical protein
MVMKRALLGILNQRVRGIKASKRREREREKERERERERERESYTAFGFQWRRAVVIQYNDG